MVKNCILSAIRLRPCARFALQNYYIKLTPEVSRAKNFQKSAFLSPFLPKTPSSCK